MAGDDDAAAERPLSPEELAREWYWTAPPQDWALGMGDSFRSVPYVYRDAPTSRLADTPVLAVCVEQPCDAGTLPRRVRRVKCARAYVLAEFLADDPRAWQALPEIAGARHDDYALLPPFPGRWEVDLLVDLGDQFAVDAAETRPEQAQARRRALEQVGAEGGSSAATCQVK